MGAGELSLTFAIKKKFLPFAVIHILNVSEASKQMWEAPPTGNNCDSNPSPSHTLRKTVSLPQQRPQPLALRETLKFSKHITLHVSHAIISRDFQKNVKSLSNHQYEILHLQDQRRQERKPANLHFFSIKMHQLFSSYIRFISP